jgi:integrase/recombinase XerD
MINTFCACLPASCRSRISRDFTRTTAVDIDAWLDAAHHRGLAPATINHILNALHRFFGFLQEQGRLPQPPMHRRRHQVLVPPTLPRPMAEGDVVQFFQVIDAVRDRAMFLLMLRCGLRVGAVSTLTWSAMDVQMGAIRIDNSTGQVDRVVYYTLDVAKALHHWRHLQSPAGPYMFPSPLVSGSPVSVRTIQRVMARYLRQARILKPYSPHALRHTFATPWLNAGAPLEVVKALMGHRSLSMTLRYAQLYEATKRQPYARAMAQSAKRHTTLAR